MAKAVQSPEGNSASAAVWNREMFPKPCPANQEKPHSLGYVYRKEA